jgi:hypothetical protein
LFIKRTQRTLRGKTYTNHLLVESVATERGPRHRVICSLGSLGPAPKAQWLKLARHLQDSLGGQGSFLHEVLFEQFVSSFASAPRELILDFDCTDDRVHGVQEGRHFHGYYYDFCFLPLYVFCGERLLVSYLRQSNIDSAKHAWAILA